MNKKRKKTLMLWPYLVERELIVTNKLEFKFNAKHNLFTILKENVVIVSLIQTTILSEPTKIKASRIRVVSFRKTKAC